jgi:hypothetical protein
MSRQRRLAFDLIPCVLLIGYGIIEPMMSIVTVPPGLGLLIWAIYRYGTAKR